MRKILSFLLTFLLASTFAYASVGYNINGTDVGAIGDINIKNTSSTATTWSDGFTLSVPVVDPNLFAAGTGNGGAVSQVSLTTAVSVSATFVRKVIPSNSDAAFTAGTLANGYPGQILTIYVSGLSPSGATTGGNYTITPVTSTGFSTVKLTAVNDAVTFLYVNDTSGWVILSQDGTVTITLKN